MIPQTFNESVLRIGMTCEEISQEMYEKAVQYCLNNPYTFGMTYLYNSMAAFIIYELFSWWFVDSAYFPDDETRQRKTLRVMHYARICLILNIGVGVWMLRNGIW